MAPLPSLTRMLHKAAEATANGTAIKSNGYTVAGIQITGTFSATLTFEASNDGGTTWVAVMLSNATSDARTTTATAAGLYMLDLSGIEQFRARISTFGSGSVTAFATLTQ